MHINLSGHHVSITDSIREAVETKLAKVNNHFPQLDSANVTLTVERAAQSIEVTTQYLGTAIAVQATDQDLYVAISSAAKKLEAALAHRKGTLNNRSHTKPELNLDSDLAATG